MRASVCAATRAYPRSQARVSAPMGSSAAVLPRSYSKRFLLLADGDFRSMLLDAAAEQQQRQQQQLHGSAMALQPLILSSIDTASRQCSSGACLFAAAPTLAFALTARFPHISYLQQQQQQHTSSNTHTNTTCNSLWRGLILHLRTEEPLRSFIGEELLQKCHKLFALLWKAHMAHRQLHASWLRGCALQKQLRQQQRAAAAAAAAVPERNLVSRATAAAREEILILQISQLTHLLNEMLHFSRQWLHFAHEEVLSPNWRIFYKAIPRCRDVDEFLGLLWQCIQQQHDGLFLFDAKEAAAAAAAAAAAEGDDSSNISVQLHALIQEMHEACSAMASRAEFRFATVAEQQLQGTSEVRMPTAAAADAGSSSSNSSSNSNSNSSNSVLAVEERRQAFRHQMLRLLQLLDAKQSEVRAAAAAAAQAASNSSSRSRIYLDHCMAIRSLRVRLDFNDFYEHQRQIHAVSPHTQGDSSVTRFPSLLLQQQHARTTPAGGSSSKGSLGDPPDKRSDEFAGTARQPSCGSHETVLPTPREAPTFVSKLQQHLLQQQQQQHLADDITRPPTAGEASGPTSPLPLGQAAAAANSPN
ncbi:uncharacterized protein LOC113146533 [Cyclospora cayetanensis]|uniref:Uncharacterized protein LOC113146533 n=1 Tax=Cyclospora cayetanensis TaxID=88456 RepID=A0A6P6RS42_9EIME|nr:uncharacterized protein LOC113146533 [Cyclospora cayetanensis]